MSSINKVVLTGGLVRKQELRNTSNSQVISFTLVETQKYNGTEQKRYFKVEAWGGIAKLVDEHLGKGAKLAIEGRLKNNSYEKDGQTIHETYVVAEKLDPLTFGKQEDDGQNVQGGSETTGNTEGLPIFEDEPVEVITEEDIQF